MDDESPSLPSSTGCRLRWLRSRYLGSQQVQRMDGVANGTSLLIRIAVYVRSRGRGSSGANPRNRVDPDRLKGRDIENTFPLSSRISTSGFAIVPSERRIRHPA